MYAFVYGRGCVEIGCWHEGNAEMVVYSSGSLICCNPYHTSAMDISHHAMDISHYAMDISHHAMLGAGLAPKRLPLATSMMMVLLRLRNRRPLQLSSQSSSGSPMLMRMVSPWLL